MTKATPIQVFFVTLLSVGVSWPVAAQSAGMALEVPPPPPVTEAKHPDESDVLDHDRVPPGELTYRDEASAEGRILHYRLASAAGEREPEPSLRGQAAAARAIDDGTMLPSAITARIVKGRSWARALGGYDTATSSARVQSAAESAVTKWFAIRVDYERSPGSGFDDRVGLGGRFQVLDQSNHGVDLGFGAFYQPKDFRGEGNAVIALMLSRRFGRFGLFGSALVGSDPEGDDQDTDQRVAMLYRATDALSIGLDNRFRYVFSTDAKRFGTITTDWELQLAPTVIVNWGPLAILSEAGLSALQNTGPIGMPENRRLVHTGLIAMAGAGAAF